MPYQGSNKLPAERAGRLGHLDVLKSPLVQQLCESFETTDFVPPTVAAGWREIPQSNDDLRLVFGIDGSLQVIVGETPPHKALAFVKTALLRLDRSVMDSIDRENPHPYALRDMLEGAAMYHATVFPLRYVVIPGITTYNAIRTVIYESLKDDSLGSEPMETLKWIAYEKWSGKQKDLPLFECPHCHANRATLSYDAEVGSCPACGGELYVSDMLGFHLEMSEDSAPDSVASDYMGIHETLMLFTGIRYFWNTNRDILKRCLFVKDGPLSIRAQYSKLVEPIRHFLGAARWEGIDICIVGQEKTGAFADHFALIGNEAPSNSIFVPGHEYIRREVQHRPVEGADYGRDTNYGAKVFYKFDNRHRLVLNIPTGPFTRDPQPDDLIGFRSIFATLPTLFSSRFENGLLPIELAHSVASLSTYPSAQILSMFADHQMAQK